MRASRILGAGAAVALLALLTVGLIELASHTSARATGAQLSLAQMRARLARSPAALASLHAQAGDLLPGGLAAARTRIDSLRGRPLVINK